MIAARADGDVFQCGSTGGCLLVVRQLEIRRRSAGPRRVGDNNRDTVVTVSLIRYCQPRATHSTRRHLLSEGLQKRRSHASGFESS